MGRIRQDYALPIPLLLQLGERLDAEPDPLLRRRIAPINDREANLPRRRGSIEMVKLEHSVRCPIATFRAISRAQLLTTTRLADKHELTAWAPVRPYCACRARADPRRRRLQRLARQRQPDRHAGVLGRPRSSAVSCLARRYHVKCSGGNL